MGANLLAAAFFIFFPAAAAARIVATDLYDGARLRFYHQPFAKQPLLFPALESAAFVVAAHAVFIAKAGDKLDFAIFVLRSAIRRSDNFEAQPFGLFGPDFRSLVIVALTMVGVGAGIEKIDLDPDVGGVPRAHELFRRFGRFFSGNDRFAAGSIIVAASAGAAVHGVSP